MSIPLGFDTGMDISILIAYATKNRSTEEVAKAIAERLASHGLSTTTCAARDATDVDRYDGIVLGSAIYTGRLHADARAFMHHHRSTFAKRPVAIFAMGPRSLDPDEVASSRRQLEAALAQEPELRPFSTVIFGGAFNPAQHHFPLNRMPVSDARDWNAIDRWADAIAARFMLHEMHINGRCVTHSASAFAAHHA